MQRAKKEKAEGLGLSAADEALWMALKEGSEIRLRQALKEGADPNAEWENGPALPSFLRAAMGPRDDFAAKAVALLTRAGAEVEMKAASGMAALHAAAWSANVGAIKALLAAGADPNARSATGSTPLHYVSGGWAPRAGEPAANAFKTARASRAGFECALLLIESGASWQAKNSQGIEPTDAIRSRGWPDLAGMIEAWMDAKELGAAVRGAGSQEQARRSV